MLVDGLMSANIYSCILHVGMGSDLILH